MADRVVCIAFERDAREFPLRPAVERVVKNEIGQHWATDHYCKRIIALEDEADGIILSAGSGAMGIRLGAPAENATNVMPVDATTVDSINLETEAPVGEEATGRALQSTVGLVWRALLLWMLLVLLLSIAKWLG